MMIQLRHPNVLLMIGIVTDLGSTAVSPETGILMELMEASLLDVIHSKAFATFNTWSNSLLSIATDVSKGMAYLHFNGILHRDLKPGNILLSEHWVAKVAGSPPCLRALRGPAHRFCPCLTLPLHADFGSGRRLWRELEPLDARRDGHLAARHAAVHGSRDGAQAEVRPQGGHVGLWMRARPHGHWRAALLAAAAQKGQGAAPHHS